MTELDLLFSNAIQFQKAGLRCFEQNDYKKFEAPLPMAIIVNLSLSAELFLKYILEKQSNRQTGHKLHELYKELSEESKFEIVKSIYFHMRLNKDFKNLGFLKTLENHSNLFYEWRYIHQFIGKLHGKKVDYGFMTSFVSILKELVDILRNPNLNQ